MFTEGDTDASPRRRLFVRGSPYGTGGDSFASELRDNSADLHTLERGEVVLAKRTACGELARSCVRSVTNVSHRPRQPLFAKRFRQYGATSRRQR